MNLEAYEELPPPTNRDDRVERINPELSCPRCPPNKGENRNYHATRNRLRNDGPRQVQLTKERNRARQAKKGEQR